MRGRAGSFKRIRETRVSAISAPAAADPYTGVGLLVSP